MKLDISPFKKAIAQLELSLSYYHSDLAKTSQELALQFRAAAIQAFEYTYELSWKMLKRYLEMSGQNPAEFDAMSFPDLIRTGCEKGLMLNDLKTWLQYRKARSLTSHTYDHEKAAEVFAVIPGFLKDANYLYNNLLERVEKL